MKKFSVSSALVALLIAVEKVMKTKFLGPILCLILGVVLLAGCAVAPVKQVTAEKIRGGEGRTIQFKKIAVDLPRGTRIGSFQTGLFCEFSGDLNWLEGDKYTLDEGFVKDAFNEVFPRELEKANYTVVGGPDSLFDDLSEWKTELLVGGLVKQIQANICDAPAPVGPKGSAYMKIEWQVYSRLERKVVYTKITEGSCNIPKGTPTAPDHLFQDAFAMATQNLLADPGFHDVVAKSQHEEAKKEAKDTHKQTFEGLLVDLEKYKKIQSSDLDEATKLAAWGTLQRKYPEWAAGVEPGDSGALLSRALATDTDRSLRRVPQQEERKAKEQHLAAIPKEVTRPIIPKVKLRDTPKDLSLSDINEMIEKFNFFEKEVNALGDFSNDLVDNGDGTVTDRATGLMWRKGGSSSLVPYGNAQKYVSRLNDEYSLGRNDWRIPTVEELASLLERPVNERGLHINSLFSHKQSLCWSSDPRLGDYRVTYGDLNHTVDFRKGGVDGAYAMAPYYSAFGTSRCFIRAVRTIK